jgi:hypothetical protein
MLSCNTVIGTFKNIGGEVIIPIPNASKIVFSIDGIPTDISINDNQHYIRYNNSDDVVEFINDPANSLNINKIYVRCTYWTETNSSNTSDIRVWALL